MSERPQAAGAANEPQAVEIPSLTDHEGYRAAKAKFDQLHQRKGELEARQRELRAQINEANAVVRSASGRTVRSAGDVAFEREVDAILDGKQTTTGPKLSELEKELGELGYSLCILTAAVERQERAVADEQSKASIALADQLRPDFHRLLKRFARALNALDEAIEAEQRFRGAIRDAGYGFPADVQPANLPGANDGPLPQMLGWFKEWSETTGVEPRRGDLSSLASYPIGRPAQR